MNSKINLSDSHRNILERTILIVKGSDIAPYVDDLLLYGSCSRGEQKFTSDIDLLLVLKSDFRNENKLRKSLHRLKSNVMPENLDDPDVDLKVVIGDEWKDSQMLFYKNIRKDGISVWH